MDRQRTAAAYGLLGIVGLGVVVALDPGAFSFAFTSLVEFDLYYAVLYGAAACLLLAVAIALGLDDAAHELVDRSA